MNALIAIGGLVKLQDAIAPCIVNQINEYVDDLAVIDLYKTNKLKKVYKRLTNV